MSEETQLFEEIKSFIITNYWDLRKGLTRETRILHDLRIAGDDAEELLEAFSERFQVDLSDFEFERYFDLEGVDPIGLSILIRKLRGDKIPKKSSHSLTLGDLEQAAINGKWIEPTED
ncbi:MAG: DUF1493 family protein [Bacteroidota bacterium]